MGVQIPNYKDIINDAMEQNDAFSSRDDEEEIETEEAELENSED